MKRNKASPIKHYKNIIMKNFGDQVGV